MASAGIMDALATDIQEPVQEQPQKRKVYIRSQPGPQTDFRNCKADILIFGGQAGGGKALAIDTPICTPSGWTTMGALKVRDLVFDEAGQVVRVTHTYAVFTPRKAYKLTFDDGASIITCPEHEWLTFNAHELAAMTTRTSAWRKARRAKRSSRISGNKSAKFTRSLIQRNKANPPAILAPPTGDIRTTEDIAKTLRLKTGRVNHAVPVCRSLQLAEMPLLIDPYLLGIWLGDGTSSLGAITSADASIPEAFREAGYQVTKYKSKYGYGIRGLKQQLRELGVFNNKHIPRQYLFASEEQRRALLQGLLDTDGYCKGSIEFCITNRRLAEGTADVIRSLGSKVNIRESRATLYGKDCGPRYRLQFSAEYPAFRLTRKLKKQNIKARRVRHFRYIVSCEEINPVPVRCITVNSKSHLYLAGRDLIPTHNSYSLLMEPLKYVDLTGFPAVIFRRTYTQIKSAGGLWEDSEELYPLLGGVPTETKLLWSFPSGASIKFAHMQHEKDRKQWDGAQIAFIGFDQLESFTEKQFTYLMGRNRSMCGVTPHIRATCNPAPDHWLRDWLDCGGDERHLGWIGDDGFPIYSRSGLLRYFVSINGVREWAETPEELIEQFGKDVKPRSFTFIPSRVTDNRILMKQNPEYLATLEGLPPAERARLRDGNWDVKETAGEFFEKSWFTIVDAARPPVREMRYWDRAGTAAEQEAKGTMSWTAGVHLRKCDDGTWCVMDVERFRKNPPEVKESIKNIATQDGQRVEVGIEQDPGQAGKAEAQDQIRNLEGFTASINVVRESKATRAKPVSSQAKVGNIKILRGDWNKAFLTELYNFDGSSKCVADQVDALSGAFYMLTEKKRAGVFNWD